MQAVIRPYEGLNAVDSFIISAGEFKNTELTRNVV